jgi:hypothetical protein
MPTPTTADRILFRAALAAIALLPVSLAAAAEPLINAAPKAAAAKPLIAAAAPKAAAGEPENPHLWKPQIRNVAVFKNGLGFFVREGVVGLRDGWCVASQVPPAAFGTLAIYSRGDKELVDIVGSGAGEVVQFDGKDAPATVEVKRARLEAAKDLKVQLQYQQKGQDRNATGKLVSVGPEYAVLEDSANSFAVPVEGVKRMQLLDLPLRIHVQGQEEKQPERVTLGMAYLRQGITWIPEYTLKVLDQQNAELTLRGTLVNQAEDLIHADVHLVVGVPHFVHTDYLAPIAVGQLIRSISAAVPSAVRGQLMNRAAIVSNSQVAQQFDVGAGEPAAEPAPQRGLQEVLGNLPHLDSAAGTDYTVYTKTDLTLREGEKAILTLFTKKISYSHIYRWSPPAAMEHSLVLHNATDTAWTTGPCLAISAERPLGEDLLRYVPRDGNGELPVTTAINIAEEKTERETDRKLKAYSPQNNVSFDLVTLEGKLKLRNFEKTEVQIVIHNPIPGKPLSADQGGTISVDPSKLRLLEREGSIRWQVKLAAGAESTLTYQYERYVPSN